MNVKPKFDEISIGDQFKYLADETFIWADWAYNSIVEVIGFTDKKLKVKIVCFGNEERYGFVIGDTFETNAIIENFEHVEYLGNVNDVDFNMDFSSIDELF